MIIPPFSRSFWYAKAPRHQPKRFQGEFFQCLLVKTSAALANDENLTAEIFLKEVDKRGSAGFVPAHRVSVRLTYVASRMGRRAPLPFAL